MSCVISGLIQGSFFLSRARLVRKGASWSKVFLTLLVKAATRLGELKEFCGGELSMAAS